MLTRTKKEGKNMRLDRIKLITEMAKQEINQKELAKKCGLTRTTLNSIVGGKSCSDVTAVKIATGLGVSVESLM